MSFQVDADAYDRFMGRFSQPLAPGFADVAGVGRDDSVLDVGCGPGALTSVLSDRCREVVAADPSEPFVAAVRTRFPAIEAVQAPAERLPFDDGRFDGCLAQLVVPFMDDPVAGLAEMARVTRTGGVVAASAWDHAGDHGPLAPFWQAVHDLDPSVADESGQSGVREGQLVDLADRAGLGDARHGRLEVRVGFDDADSWWQTFTLGVGPAGSYVAGLDHEHREALRTRFTESLGTGAFEVTALAWTVVGRVPDRGVGQAARHVLR